METFFEWRNPSSLTFVILVFRIKHRAFKEQYTKRWQETKFLHNLLKVQKLVMVELATHKNWTHLFLKQQMDKELFITEP